MLMNLEHEFIEKLAKDVADEIDFDILSEALGWTKVKLDKFVLRFRSLDMDIWCEQNCLGKFRSFGHKFLFENPRDATMFILRWA